MSARMLPLCAALALGLLIPSAATGQSAEPRTSLPDLEDEVMCPVCGTTLELAEAPQAEREREQIRRLIAQGLTKDEIKDELVSEYGPEVLAAPETSGFDLTAWVLPALGLIAAAGALAAGLARGRRLHVDAGDDGLSEEDRIRLESDMSSFDR